MDKHSFNISEYEKDINTKLTVLQEKQSIIDEFACSISNCQNKLLPGSTRCPGELKIEEYKKGILQM